MKSWDTRADSVETDEKKVALSFDAAWGDGYLGYKKWIKYERERQLLPLTKSIKSYKIKEKV